MSYSRTEEIVFLQGELIAKNYGYGIYDVEIVKEGPHKFLRVYVSCDDGVDLDICEKISRELSEFLDREDIIPDAYFLEVSSPGIERVLKTQEHFLGAIGETIKVKLVKQQDDAKEYEGELLGATEKQITLKLADKEIEIEKSNIKKANVVFNF